MNDKKDYSLLRPFDLEAAKAGEPIIWWYSIAAVFIGESINKRNVGGRGEQFRIETSSGLSYAYADDLKMAPLAWVEGCPVYKGDVLYNRLNDNKVVFDHMCAACNVESTFTWQKPKVKKSGWVNIYPSNSKCVLHNSKELADAWATLPIGIINPARIACIEIHWEE